MHNKSNSANIAVDQVIAAINDSLSGLSLANHEDTSSVQKKILLEADKVLTDGKDDNLEDKIILAMGIRLRAERHMKFIYTQNEKELIDEKGEQTGRWYGSFCTDYPLSDSIPLLKLVNIVTPETLHINSFMYEPIIDMSIEELQTLYGEICPLPQ